jgi:NAD(P)H-dependent FMN reductase
VRIVAISGSLQRKSSNLTLLEVALRVAPAGVDVVIFDGIRELPHFNPDLEEPVPPPVAAWRHALGTSDGVLIASPEYGHSLPGALKNAIDWVIGSAELERKIVAVTAAVPGPERGRRGLRALMDTLGAVSATVVGGEPIVKGADFDAKVAELVGALVAEIERSQ